VGLDELPCRKTSFLDRESFRILCAAEFFDRTNFTFRLPRKTNEGAEIDKSGVETRGAAFGHELRRAIPEDFTTGGFIDRSLQIENARQNTGGVGFNDWNRLVESETRDRVGGIFSNAGQLSHLIDRLWETATISIHDRFRRGSKIASPSVITESLPGVEDFTFRSARQR
jgi:hypothetical protein